MARNLIENIDYLRDMNKVFKDMKYNTDLTDAIEDVCEYAMDSYVSDAEDMGYTIVENIDVIEERSYDKGQNDAVKKACAWINNNLTQYFSDHNLRFKVKENFLKDMEI